MKFLQAGTFALLGVMVAGMVLADPATAKPGRGNGNGNGNGNRPTPVETVETDDEDAEVEDRLTEDQVDTLLDIIQGTDEDFEDLISEDLRLAILEDLDSLPPGIQRRLARGRGLPPGIAKKYQMPTSVLSVLDLDPDIELLIIGDNIVIVNPSDVILDLVEDIL